MVTFFFSSRRRHTRFKCDWSSDVCSSDLCPRAVADFEPDPRQRGDRLAAQGPVEEQIGRASGRERVEISVVAVSLKKKLRRGLAIDSTVDIFTFYVPHRHAYGEQWLKFMR